MNVVRTVASALCIVIGALLIATWAASTAALGAVEDGTVIEDATVKAVTSQVGKKAIVDGGTERVLGALDSIGISTSIPGLEKLVTNIVDAIVSSDTFSEVVHAQTASMREQVVDELNSGGEGPITVTLDFSDEVNGKLGEIPIIGGSLPEVTVPGVPVQVMDAQTADSARGAWDFMHVAKKWFGWLGLAALAVGIIVSYRRRWYFAKVALAVAALSGAAWAILTYAEPQSIADRIPGQGFLDVVVMQLANDARESFVTTIGYFALGAMIVAIVLGVLAIRSKRRSAT